MASSTAAGTGCFFHGESDFVNSFTAHRTEWLAQEGVRAGAPVTAGEMVLEGGEAEEEDGGVYRPPKLREVAMKEDMEESRLKKEMRAAKERRRR